MAATVTAYSVLARSMAKELLPQELRAAARWAVSALLPRPKQRRTKTILIGRYTETHDIESPLYWEVRRYLSSRIDPGAVDRLGLTVGGPGLGHQILSVPPGESTTDVFEGVKFTWTLTYADDSRRRGRDAAADGGERRAAPDTLAVSFDAEHMEVALRRYVPFIMATMEEARRQERALKIYRMSSGSHSPWEGSGSSWEGLSHHHPATFDTLDMKDGVTLSGMLNFIDGLWSTSGEERIVVFTTNYKDRLDRALLRPGPMDMHIYMGYCGWEAFKTLARNYFLVDDHELFPEIRELLSAVEVTPAEVSEMLLRSEDVDAALQGFAEFFHGKSSK